MTKNGISVTVSDLYKQTDDNMAKSPKKTGDL
jgi:hypothetical protein